MKKTIAIVAIVFLWVVSFSGCRTIGSDLPEEDVIKESSEELVQRDDPNLGPLELGGSVDTIEDFADIFSSTDTVYFIEYNQIERDGTEYELKSKNRPVIEIKSDGTYIFLVNLYEGMIYTKGTYQIKDRNHVHFTEDVFYYEEVDQYIAVIGTISMIYEDDKLMVSAFDRDALSDKPTTCESSVFYLVEKPDHFNPRQFGYVVD